MGQFIGNGKVVGDKDQQIARSNLNPLAIVPEEKRDPRHNDDDRDGNENVENVVVVPPLSLEAEGKTVAQFLTADVCVKLSDNPFTKAKLVAKPAVSFQVGVYVKFLWKERVNVDEKLLSIKRIFSKVKIRCLQSNCGAFEVNSFTIG